MAKEWYLIGIQNSATSDHYYEENFSAFDEALSSDMASDIEICNYDLSIRNKVRAIVEGNVQDTKLNSLQRKILVKIGSCKSGDYVYYRNRYWIITGIVDNNGVYEKAVMIICNYYLTWINSCGDIIQRWANIASASQYNNGEFSSKNITIRNDQILVTTTDDRECLLLTSGNRFILDKRCKLYEEDFDLSIESDTSHPVITYKITRVDNFLFDYQTSGICQFLFSQDDQQSQDGYYNVYGEGYWLCGIPQTIDKKVCLSSMIDISSDVVYVGLEPEMFTAYFYDERGRSITVQPIWSISGDKSEKLNVSYEGNSIMISTDDNSLLGKKYTLTLSAENYPDCKVDFAIRAFI